jgi:hypothetical protein
MTLFGDADATWVAVAMSAVAMIGGAITLVVNATKERREKRDALEFGAELAKLKISNVELVKDRDECVKQHAEKDEKITHLEGRLDNCLKDHEESQKDRQNLWAAIQEMKAGPV